MRLRGTSFHACCQLNRVVYRRKGRGRQGEREGEREEGKEGRREEVVTRTSLNTGPPSSFPDLKG